MQVSVNLASLKDGDLCFVEQGSMFTVFPKNFSQVRSVSLCSKINPDQIACPTFRSVGLERESESIAFKSFIQDRLHIVYIISSE